MNQQCLDCYIRKFCYEKEPEEDWTCSEYVRPPEPTTEKDSVMKKNGLGKIDLGRAYVYVVGYQDGAEEPVISVFNNVKAAEAFRDAEENNHDRIWMDMTPIFSKTCIDGKWIGN